VQGDGFLAGVDVPWRDERIAGVVALDFPVVVVHEQVMVSAEQDPVFKIGFAVVAPPVIDVVGFGPRRRPFTIGENATAVSGGEGDLLVAGEETLFPPQVQGLPVTGNGYDGGAAGAGETLDGLD
jgi:hypothetical protein